MHNCIYIYIYMHIWCVYIYIYREREGDTCVCVYIYIYHNCMCYYMCMTLHYTVSYHIIFPALGARESRPWRPGRTRITTTKMTTTRINSRSFEETQTTQKKTTRRAARRASRSLVATFFAAVLVALTDGQVGNPLNNNSCVVFTYSVCFKQFHLKRRSPQGDLKQETYRKAVRSCSLTDGQDGPARGLLGA